jgi:hypothetical protein
MMREVSNNGQLTKILVQSDENAAFAVSTG